MNVQSVLRQTRSTSTTIKEWQAGHPIVASTLTILASIFLGFIIPYWVLVYIFGMEFRRPEQQFINMLARGSIYTMFALGYALVFSILGLLNLAHSSIYMWGAAAGLYIVMRFPDLSIWYALPAGMLVGGLLGVLVDWVAFLPLRIRKAPRAAQLISSIGASIFLVNLAFILFIVEFKKAKVPFPRESVNSVQYFQGTPLDMTSIKILGVTIWKDVPFLVRPIQITTFVVAMLLLILLQYMVARTKVGKAMRVVAFNQQTAKLLGINVSLIFALTFFLAGALAGAAGVLQGIAQVVDPFMGGEVALIGLTVIVLGGMGKIQGAVVGAFLVANMEIVSIAVQYGWLSDAVVFIALFLMLLLRPQGILGDPIQDRA